MRPLDGLGGDGRALGVAELRPQAGASLLDPLHHRSQPHQDDEYQHTLETENMKTRQTIRLCMTDEVCFKNASKRNLERALESDSEHLHIA